VRGEREGEESSLTSLIENSFHMETKLKKKTHPKSSNQDNKGLKKRDLESPEKERSSQLMDLQKRLGACIEGGSGRTSKKNA